MTEGGLATDCRSLLQSRLTYYLRCLREDATDPELSNPDRLAVVRERVEHIRAIRAELKDPHVRTLYPRS